MEIIRPGEIHPLQNPVVQNNLFKYLLFSDLRSCRLVSKLWHKIFTKPWRSSSILAIDSSGTTNENAAVVSMTEFLKFAENERNECIQSPFTNVVLHEHSNRFETLCGPFIKHLEIRGYKEIMDFDAFPEQRNPEEREVGSVVLSSLRILDCTPTLEKVVLSKGCLQAIQRTDMAKMSNVLLLNCTELVILEEELEENDLKKLMEWMPNVKTLKMALNNETFSLVCKRWTNLRSMEITCFGLLDDCGITGLEHDDVQKINGLRDTEVLPSSLSMLRNTNITDLKYLEHVSFLGGSGFSVFGYCAAVCGFLEMPDVKLHFQNCYVDGKHLWQYGTACKKISSQSYYLQSTIHRLKSRYQPNTLTSADLEILNKQINLFTSLRNQVDDIEERLGILEF